MVATASSADPQSHNHNYNNHPSSSSSSMAHQHHQEDEDDERENPKSTSSLKLPQRSRTSHITSSKFTTTPNNNNNNILPKFSSLPCFTVQWGRQFRCVTRNPKRSPPPHPDDDDNEDDGGIVAMREKLMLDFRTKVQQIQAEFIHHTHSHNNNIDNTTTHPINHHDNTNTNTANHNNNNDTSTNDNNGGDKRPWNLRTRRAVCKDPNGGGGVERKPTSSPVKFTDPTQSPFKSNGVNGHGDAEVLPSSSRTRRKKFSASLSKKEIDEDFIAMGAWPAKRPKKRPKLVQRQIDVVFPGYWLSEITAKMYKVNEHP